MSTDGNSRKQAEAKALETEAQGLLATFKALATARAKELNVRGGVERMWGGDAGVVF